MKAFVIMLLLLLLAGAAFFLLPWSDLIGDRQDPAATEQEPPRQEDPNPASPDGTTQPQQASTAPPPRLEPGGPSASQPEPEPESEPANFFPSPSAPGFSLPRSMQDIPRILTLSADLWNGLRLQSLFTVRPISGGVAELLDQPVLHNPRLDLAMTEPSPARKTAQLRTLNPELPDVLPALETLLSTAEPSLYFDELYESKRERNQDMMPRLDNVLSRHNYLDCETVLHLTAPETGRKALFIQSEMDVLTDGSDGDRMPVIAGESPTFQPFTSYAWSKRGDKPNPFLPQVREEQRELRAELETNPGSARERQIRDRLDRLELYESDMKSRSHLVGEIDPFIALPLSMVRGPGSSHKPDIGDFAVVIYKDTLYPALVGDAGPRFKMGEASMLICKEINPNTTIYSRPVSDLTVTYVVFPNSAEHPFGPPDYIHIRDRCAQLLEELGGFSGTLHKWIEETGTKEAVPADSVDPGVARSSPFQEAAAVLTAEQLLRSATPTPAASASGGARGS